MGNIDTESKKYMEDSTHFADAFNYLIYDGKPVIDPKALSPLDSTEIVVPYGNEAKAPKQKYRDVLKLWQAMTDGETIYAVLGSEIQANVHYAMPVKDGLYDFMNYAKQVEEAKKSYLDQNEKQEKIRLTSEEFLSGFRKEDKLMPVITLVLYLGPDNWDGPMSIHEMLNTQNDQLLQFVPDYRINLIAPIQIPDGDFLKFHTGLGKVLQYIKYSKDKEELDRITHEGDRFRNIDADSANLINITTGSELKFEVKEGVVDVCTAIDEMRKESRNEGWIEGQKDGWQKGQKDGWQKGQKDGWQKGQKDGVMETLSSLVNKGLLPLAVAAGEAGLSADEFLAKTSEMNMK